MGASLLFYFYWSKNTFCEGMGASLLFYFYWSKNTFCEGMGTSGLPN